MGYSSDINSNIIPVAWESAATFAYYINGGKYNTDGVNDGRITGDFDGANNMEFHGIDIHNTASGVLTYNLYDLIAAAKQVGYSHQEICDALNKTLTNPQAPRPKEAEVFGELVSGLTWESGQTAPIAPPNGKKWTLADITKLNSETTKASKELQRRLTEKYPNSNPRVRVRLKPNGEGYTYYVVFNDPNDPNGEDLVVDVAEPKDGNNYTQTELDSFFSRNNELGSSLSDAEAHVVSIKNAKANATAGKTALGTISENLPSGANAKTDYGITEEDYAALRAAIPNFDQLVTGNKVNASSWIKDVSKVLADNKGETFKGASLEGEGGYEDNARSTNEAIAALANSTIQKQQGNLLNQIRSDPELYKAVTEQLRAGALSNRTVGQTASNVGASADKVNQSYKTAADKLYESIGGAGAESLAKGQRDSTYNNLTEALASYTSQQLSQMNADQRLQSDDVAKLLNTVKLITSAAAAENAKVNRQAVDEQVRSANEETTRSAIIDAESKLSAAANDASTKQMNDISSTIIEMATDAGADNTALIEEYVKGTGLAANASSDNIAAATGAILPETEKEIRRQMGAIHSTRAIPNYAEANYIDESTYNAIVNNPDTWKVLDPEVFNRLTAGKSASQLANKYDVGYLANQDDTVKKFTEYAEEANKASDRTFNAAQQAYLASIAAGDVKAVDQLTRLARTAGTQQRNLYGATALSNQFAQQRNNRTVGNTLTQDARAQQAANQQQLSDAISAGRSAWTGWLGTGQENENSLYNAQQQNLTNSTNALGGYIDLVESGMNSQATQNDIISNNTNTTNKNLANFAANITGANATGAVSNITNKVAMDTLKKKLSVQEGMLQQVIDDGRTVK